MTSPPFSLPPIPHTPLISLSPSLSINHTHTQTHTHTHTHTVHACSVCYGKAADLVVKYKIIIEAVGDYSSRDGMSITHTLQSIITVTRARPSKHKLHVGVVMTENSDYIQYNRTTSKYTHMHWHCPYQVLYQPHYAVCIIITPDNSVHAYFNAALLLL